MKRIKPFAYALLSVLLILVIVAGGYVGYLFASYSRIEDHLALKIDGTAENVLCAGKPQSIVSWNLGFGAYSADYSFFMDGGKESRARSEAAVYENIGGAIEKIQDLNADFMLLQEIDIDATRSHHIDQSALIQNAFPTNDGTVAVNYDSAYLFYPLTEPHGASKSGLMTMSKFDIESAVRHSLPVETGFMKFLDLDRCYSVSRIPVDNGRELCLYNLHLSAYTSDGIIAMEQLELLLSDMQTELDAGNYVIAGGDFNKDLPGNSPELFGVSGENCTWAQPLPHEMIPKGFGLVDTVDPDFPVPSCRNADKPYVPGESFVVTVDGFIVSENVSVISARVENEGFAVSDHNPVVMEFVLEG